MTNKNLIPFDPDLGDALAHTIANVGEDGFEAALSLLLTAVTGFESMLFVAFFVPGSPRRLFDNLSDSDRALTVRPYLDRAYLLDPWFNMVLEGAPDGIYRLNDYVPEDFKSTEYYREFYSKIGLSEECGIFIRLSDVACLVLSLGIHDYYSPIDADGMRLRPFFASVRALCTRHWRSLVADHRSESLSLRDICAQKGLSGREIEVTTLLLRGFSNKEIARALNISPETVKVYRKRVYSKLSISSVGQLFTEILQMRS